MVLEPVDLEASKQKLWDIGYSEVDDYSNLCLVVMSYKGTLFLFVKQNQFQILAESLYEHNEEISLNQVMASTATNAVPGPFHLDIHYGLFLVEGFSSLDQLVKATLRNIRGQVTVVKLLDKHKIQVQDRIHFNALFGFGDQNPRSVKRFFRDRRIISGVFEVAYINDFLLHAAISPSAIKEFLDTQKVPENYFVRDYPWEPEDVHCQNRLYYVAEQEQFRFEVKIRQEPNSNEAELVERIRRVLDLVFRDIDAYVKAEGEDSALLDILGCSADEFGNIWEAFHLWRNRDENDYLFDETEELVRNWIRPEVVEILVESFEIDPSRGTRLWSSTKVKEYSETVSEWMSTKFDKLDPKSYLERLQSQYAALEVAGGKVERAPYLEIPIEDIELSIRTYNCLKRKGIDTLSQMISLTENELLELDNLGPKGIVEISNKVHEMGLGFLTEATAWPFTED